MTESLFPQYSKLILLTTDNIIMVEKPTYKELEHKITQLEREILEYVRKEKEFTKEQKLVEYGHVRRTISLMKINEELNREIKGLKRANKEELGYVSNKLKGRIKEIKCLYDISSLRDETNFSLDDILQGIVDFIPSAIPYPEIACARILFNRYDFKTKNFKATKWKLSQEIKVNNKRIGTLEVCYLEEKPELEEEPFIEETKILITSIAETIAQIVERDWAEIEIRKCRKKIEEILKQN
jgi:hypothetical protein